MTAERLRELLNYDPETGQFTWRVQRGPHKPGSRAGCLNKFWNRLYIRVDGPLYFLHRLAWLWMTGEWPENEVDHIDGDSQNNRWENLRDITRAQNEQNRSIGRGRHSSIGVGYRKDKGKWRAYIGGAGGRRFLYLGYFDTKAEAEAAYLAAKKIYHHPGRLTHPDLRNGSK